MSDLVLLNAFVKVDTVDLSNMTSNIGLTYSAAAVAVTTMGDGYEANDGGLKKWAGSFDFLGDEETAGELFDKVGTKVDVEVRADAGTRSAANPSYIGTGIVTEATPPVAGGVGDAKKVTLSIVGSGPLLRKTTADAEA